MLALQSLRFGYKKTQPLFSSLNFSIEKGGVYGLLGKNGAGKTTMLKLSAGLLFPHAGTATLFGHDAGQRKPEALSRLAFVPEIVAVPALSVSDFISLYGGYYPAFDGNRMADYMGRLEVPAEGRLDRMSLGQKKKALLAFAFSSGSELVFLDEPTNGLDIPSKQVFRRMVAESVDENRAFVISTHQVRDVQNLIDPVVILHDGDVILHSEMERILSRLGLRVFSDEAEAFAAGALAVQHELGRVIALVGNGDVRPDEKSDEIDLELLFQAAIDHPDRMKELMGGAA